MRMMTDDDKFLKLLKKKHYFYSSILEITKEEHRKLETSCPLEEIRFLLGQKKALLQFISSLEDEIAPLKAVWKMHPTKERPCQHDIQTELKELSLLLDEILKLDTQNQRALQSQLTSIRPHA